MSSTFLNDENKGDIIIYQSESGETKIDVRFQDETVWLTQAQLCELYQSSKANVSEHIKNIFEEGELEQSAVVRKIRTTAANGKNYQVLHYNLDVIIYKAYDRMAYCQHQSNNYMGSKVAPQQSNQQRCQHHKSAHRRCAAFRHMACRSALADRLAELQLMQIRNQHRAD